MLLTSWLGALFQRFSRPVVRTRRSSRRLSGVGIPAAVQRLEPRVLLSASPVGSEFQVNTYTTGDQTIDYYGQGGGIATDARGDYVVAWTSDNQDGSGAGVYAQRYNAAGVAQGGEFQVNTTTADQQFSPTVAMDAAGDFVVTWSSYGQDGSNWGVYGQRYNAAGVAQGGEFRVNTTTANNQSLQSVSMDAAGDFVVTWMSFNQDGSGAGVYAQRYNAAGVAQGGEFQVNTTTTSDQTFPSVAMDAAGDFVITWMSANQDGSGAGVYAQRYNAAGVAQGGEFQVNTTTANNQTFPTVAMDTAGDFVVTWTSYNQDGSGAGVYAQRYNAAGVAQGGEFQVNTTTANPQRLSTVAMDSVGDFIVTWSSYAQDGSSDGIYAQRYDAAGVAQGGEFRVNTTTVNSQVLSTVAMDAAGDFVVGWMSQGQDGSGWGVYAQRYDESTDTAGPIVAQVLNNQTLIAPNGALASAVSSLTVVFSEDLNVAGGASGTNSATNPANWQLTRNGTDISSQISGITFGYNATTNKYEAVLSLSSPLTSGAIALTARQTIQDLAGNALDGDLNGTPGGDFTRSFSIGVVAPAGGEFQVNTYTTGDQRINLNAQGGGIATDARGDYVVTWSSDNQDGSGAGVYAQRYNAAGVAQGGEFRVNTTTANNQLFPTVAMDAAGDFVVAWMSNSQDGSGGGVYAQRYNAAGVAQGGEFRVNTTTANNQGLPTVAMDAAGDFIVTWSSLGQDGSGYGVYAQRYNAAGVAQGGEFQVNTTAANDQFAPTVAMDAGGDYVVTWSSLGQDGSGTGVYAQRYNAAGVAQGGEFRVNTTTSNNQNAPTVAMDAAGDFVVTWSSLNQDGSSYGVYAQRYNAAGVAQGGEFRVNTTTANNQLYSTVSMDSAGDFIVTWSSMNQDGSDFGVYAQRYNVTGAALGGEFRVNTTTVNGQALSTVAMDAAGDFVVGWESLSQDGSGWGVYAQRYSQSPDAAGPIVAQVLDGDRLINAGDQLVSSVTSLTVVFSEDLNVAGGASGANSVTNPANWTLTRNGVDIGSNISGITFGFNPATNRYEAVLNFTTPLADGVIQLTAKQSIQDVAANALDGDLNGAPGGNFTRSFAIANVLPAGGEFQVNTTTANDQFNSTIAMDADGDFVVTWSSYDQDGSGPGIYAQRYNAAGVAQGGEFRVNSTTAGDQKLSSVAMDAGGDFVVTWSSYNQDGSIGGIYAQRYNAAGVAQGGEFRVNSTTAGNQRFSSIAMDVAGDFIVTWSSYGQDGSGYGVYAQRYNAAGIAQGGEFQVNSTTAGKQDYSSVAIDADGDFIVTWSSYGQDGSGYGVYAQRYNAAGLAQGAEFRVNTTTTNSQLASKVAMDAAGDFVVTWVSQGQDGSGLGVYAQRYNAAGVAQGAEFRVNTTTTNTQKASHLAIDSAGDFIITWSSNGQDGSSYGVYAQRYNAAGVAQGGEFRVNTETSSEQWFSHVGMDADGDFVIAWNSNLQDGSGNGVYAQRYTTNISPVLAATGNLNYTENDPATAIDAGITVSDADNSTLSSATVTITNYVPGQDLLTFTNDGLTMGNIAVVTNVGGVLTLTSSGGSATTAEWQAALRAVTYANSSDTPDTTQRSVDIVVNDGLSPSNTLTSTINITATNDAPVLTTAGNITYTENDPATAIDTGLTVSDVDNATLSSATVTLTNFVAGQDLLAFTNDGLTMGNIAVASNAAGVLTLTSAGSTATTAQWQAALRAVTYANSSDNPDTTQRSVDFVVNDGAANSNTVTSTININAVNDAPVLAVAGNITYTENGAATAIDTGLTVSDADNATLSSATVTITNYVAGQDVLAFTNDGLTMGNIAVASNAAGVLTLTSAGSTATTAEWQAALRAVTYANSSDNPDTTQRSVDFVVNDGAANSNAVTSTINITASNDAPVVANLETTTLPYVPNGPAVAVTSTLTLSDADSPNLTGATVIITGYQAGDVLQFTNTPNITGVFVGGTLTLTGSDTVANYESAIRSIKYVSTSQSPAARAVNFQVTDGTDPSNIQSRTVGGYAQLVGATLNVYGTPQLDAISVGEGATLDVVVNGVLTQFTPAQVNSIFIFGFAGDDTIQVNSLKVGTSLTAFGMTGNDTLRVNAGVTQGVTLNGGNDNDLLIGGSGNDTLVGGLGNDWLNGGDGNDNLSGGAGNDVYAFSDTATNQVDTVTEESDAGVDALNFTAMTTGVTVNLTSDTATATMLHRIVKVGPAGQSANLENVFGGSADDVITGNALANVIYGNGGNDTLMGGAGSDQLDGGSGNDLLKGGDQSDILIGGIGDDYLKGEGGNDFLSGGDGFNTLAGGANDDTYLFQAATVNQVDTVLELADDGTDTLNFAALTTSVVVNLTSDTALATMDHRIVQAGSGQSANVENVVGGSGNDQITGNAANNLLSGNGGNDTISGGAGNDILVGGDGNDTLKGISGLNILIGGAGADLLLGGTGEDLMMSGSTVYDSNPALLQYLAAEWTSGNPYQTRIDHLLGTTPGGANFGVTLNPTSAHTDPDADYLTGGTGRDWFLAGSLQDVLTDQAADDVFTHIDTWL